MRTVLVTGPGGAGRTTLAAATALAGARRGERVLLLTARGGAAERVLGTRLGRPGDGPVPVVPGLHAKCVDAGDHFRREVLAFQERAGAALDLLGAAPLDEDELTELPGAEAFALLHELRAAHETAGPDGQDTVVVDMPPAADTVALLALPEQARRYLRRLLPPERQAARALRPVLAQLAGVQMPTQKLYEAAERWEHELAAVQRIIDHPGTTVRIVTEAGPAAVADLREVRSGLALYGHRTDAVVANRLLPTGSADPFLAALSGQQQSALKALREEFPEAPVVEVPHLGRDPEGTEELGPWRTGWPRTASWCGGCRCRAPNATGWACCGAATRSSSPSAASVGYAPCPPRCAAARSPAPGCARARCTSVSPPTRTSGPAVTERHTAVRVTSGEAAPPRTRRPRGSRPTRVQIRLAAGVSPP